MNARITTALDQADIRGLDAATMCRHAVCGLERASGSALRARTELGLRGDMSLTELFDGLAAAAASMEPFHFQRSAAALLGADAVRLAGVAARSAGGGLRAPRK